MPFLNEDESTFSATCAGLLTVTVEDADEVLEIGTEPMPLPFKILAPRRDVAARSKGLTPEDAELESNALAKGSSVKNEFKDVGEPLCDHEGETSPHDPKE